MADVDKVAPIEDPAARADIESKLLGWAAARVTTPAQLGAKARREVLARDARGAARRLTTALRERGVYLLAVTDWAEVRRAGTCGAPACRRRPHRCEHDLAGRSGLGPPGATAGYRPDAALDRYVRARDRRCRFPGCRRRVPRGGELDHDRPYPDGPTSADNLAGYCTGHHRGKHQAPGWQQVLAPDPTLTVTTPTGLVASTVPPPY